VTDDLLNDFSNELATIGNHICRLQERVAELEAREERRQTELFQRMWASAMAGDKVMLIWLSKQVLLFRDGSAPSFREGG
jgi:hypothetical protein